MRGVGGLEVAILAKYDLVVVIQSELPVCCVSAEKYVMALDGASLDVRAKLTPSLGPKKGDFPTYRVALIVFI